MAMDENSLTKRHHASFCLSAVQFLITESRSSIISISKDNDTGIFVNFTTN